MDTPQRKKEKSLIIGLVGLIIVIIILAMIGFFMLKPGDETIQGQAEATQVRVSGKLPGRIVEFMVEDGQSVHKGDTLVRIFSSDAGSLWVSPYTSISLPFFTLVPAAGDWAAIFPVPFVCRLSPASCAAAAASSGAVSPGSAACPIYQLSKVDCRSPTLSI